MVLPGADGSPTFHPTTNAWHWASGVQKTFHDLKAKYPGPCGKLLCKLLAAQDHFLSKTDWDSDRTCGIELRAVVSDLNRVFKKLGYKGPDPIQNQRGTGYTLLPSYVGKPYEWTRRGRMVDLPHLRWIDQIIDLVRAGRWIQVRMLPGNGAELVYDLLTERLSQARIVPIDLAPINDQAELLKIFAAQAEEPTAAFANDGRTNFTEIARTVAGSSDLLTIVVENWGSFARSKTPEDLKQVALALTGFKNVLRPRVAVALITPTQAHHLLPVNSVGSLLQLQSVFPADSDTNEIEEWALAHFVNVPESDIKTILTAACGQLGAVQAAANPMLRNQNERLQAVLHAHQDAGLSILGTVGPCCRDVLLEKSRRPRCVTVLKEAGILREEDGGYHAFVQAWTSSWIEARRQH